jgi:hypothetical protein
VIGTEVGYQIRTQSESVPAWAVLTRSTECAWIRGTSRTRVLVAEESDEMFGLTVFVWRERGGQFPELLYIGEDRAQAGSVADQAVAQHGAEMERLSHSEAGVRVDTPTTSW